MNEHLPPIDSKIRAQLERRSGGRMPDDLGARVSKALDGTAEVAGRGAGSGSRLAWPGVRWTGPRLAGSAIAVAFIAILAVGIGLPALRSGPGSASGGPVGYPADRALTTAELATLMAGPALATNTALVASVTIDAKTDVCPMDRYPTVGVIEGMGSQVCVMGANVSAYMSADKASGVFAFRFIAPGVLGLLGQITPASDSKLAFGAAAEWPTGTTYPGKTLLVEGWLGSTPYPESIGSVQIACDQPLYGPGDPLDPESGDNLCSTSWLADDPSTGATLEIGDGRWSESVPGGHAVTAGGARYYDSIPTTPTRGVYVVLSVTGPCPGAPLQSSVACDEWRVLAKVDALRLPAPSASTPAGTPSPSIPSATRSTPPASPVAEPSGPLAPAPVGLLGSGNRPLTQGEFAALWAADPAHLAGRIVIAKGPVPTGFECWSSGAADASAPPGTCHVAILDGQIAQDGYWAIGVGADGKLSIVGELSTPESSFVFTLAQVNASTNLKAGDLVVVDAWLVEYVLTCDRDATPLPSACGPYSALESTASDNSPASLYVQLGAFEKFTGSSGDWTIDGPPVHGLFLVRLTNQGGGTLLARLEPASLP